MITLHQSAWWHRKAVVMVVICESEGKGDDDDVDDKSSNKMVMHFQWRKSTDTHSICTDQVHIAFNSTAQSIQHMHNQHNDKRWSLQQNKNKLTVNSSTNWEGKYDSWVNRRLVDGGRACDRPLPVSIHSHRLLGSCRGKSRGSNKWQESTTHYPNVKGKSKQIGQLTMIMRCWLKGEKKVK